MSPIIAIVVVVVGLFFFMIGVWYGNVGTVQSLLIDAYKVDKTPHKLGDAFYYIVPEREYIAMANWRLRRK